MTDLSKAFDCIPHDLLIAKLEACGLGEKALSYIFSYLTNRNQCVRINDKKVIYLLESVKVVLARDIIFCEMDFLIHSHHVDPIVGVRVHIIKLIQSFSLNRIFQSTPVSLLKMKMIKASWLFMTQKDLVRPLLNL